MLSAHKPLRRNQLVFAGKSQAKEEFMCNYLVLCNKTLATVSGVSAVLPAGAWAGSSPVLLCLTQGWREELLLLVVNTKGVGPASSQPC